jgi:lantibiotic biosynthesis protein
MGARDHANGVGVDAFVRTDVCCAWPAILDGDVASRARGVAHDIARALANRSAANASEATDAAIYWAYAAEYFSEPWAERALDQAMRELAEAIAKGVPSLALFGGLTGAAWAAHHIAGAPGDSEPEDPEDLPPRVDALLVDALSRPQWDGHYDLISGLVGFGVYLLARGNRPVARRGLALTLAHLETLAQPVAGGIGWLTLPALLPAHHRRTHPEGLFDLGVAHGVAGVIALYSAVLRARALPECEANTRRSLAAAVGFVEANRRADREQSAFDWSVATGVAGSATRTAWCYGDLGIAIALLRAAYARDDDASCARALSLARACATRADAVCGVRDAGVCHGAAGLGHLLNRLFHATGDEALREGARRWFRNTLELRRPGALAGFPALVPARAAGEPETWHASPGILDGAAGVGLALMSALGGAPDWDQPLLTDISSRV